MKRATLLAAALAVTAAAGCSYRETTDDGSRDRVYEGTGMPPSHSGAHYDERRDPARQHPAPAPGPHYMPGSFGDPGPNYPYTGH